MKPEDSNVLFCFVSCILFHPEFLAGCGPPGRPPSLLLPAQCGASAWTSLSIPPDLAQWGQAEGPLLSPGDPSFWAFQELLAVPASHQEER